MAAPKGHPRYGGRQKGTPNKSSTGLLTRAEEMGVDLWAQLLKLTQSPNEQIQMAAIKEACSYVFAKRKSLEHSGSLDPKIVEASEQLDQMSKDEQIQALEQALKALKG